MQEITNITLAKDLSQTLFSLTAGQGFNIHVNRNRPKSEKKLLFFWGSVRFNYGQTTNNKIQKSYFLVASHKNKVWLKNKSGDDNISLDPCRVKLICSIV